MSNASIIHAVPNLYTASAVFVLTAPAVAPLGATAPGNGGSTGKAVTRDVVGVRVDLTASGASALARMLLTAAAEGVAQLDQDGGPAV